MWGTQNNEYIYCSWLPILTRCQDSIAEDTPHSTCWAKKNYSWTEHETTFLLVWFHSATKCYVGSLVRKTINGLIQYCTPHTTILTHQARYAHLHINEKMVYGVTKHFLEWIWGLPYKREFMLASVNMAKTPLLEKSQVLAEEESLFIVSVDQW